VRQRAPVGGGAAGRAGLVAADGAARVGHPVVHHVNGHALEADACPARGQAEVHDGAEAGFGEGGDHDVARGLVLHGQDQAPDVAVADDPAIGRLGQLLGWVLGVAGKRLEPGDEDVARGHEAQAGVTPSRWRWASAW
jgi:hypothetical protein